MILANGFFSMIVLVDFRSKEDGEGIFITANNDAFLGSVRSFQLIFNILAAFLAAVA